MRHAVRAPVPTAQPTTQNSPPTPITAPAEPKSMGMSTLDALMAMSRRPSASPWRAGGVIWCSRLITMGCTEPSANPSSTEHAPMASADPGQAPDTVLATVCDCADRHLGLDLERWSEPVWAACAQEHALTRPQRLDTFHGLRDNRFAATGPSPVGAMPSLWS